MVNDPAQSHGAACGIGLSQRLAYLARPRRLREPLQTDPKELPHPRRQIEVGEPAGHAEQFQAEERHYVANDDPDQESPGCDARGELGSQGQW